MKWLKWVWSLLGGTPAPAPEFVVAAQAKTVEICDGFLPTASTVIAIFGALSGQAPVAATVVGVATTICKAVKSTKVVSLLAGEEPEKPTVEIGGVEIVIEGTFVGKK